MKRRIISILVVLAMLLSMFPATAMAAEDPAITIETGQAASYPGEAFLAEIVLGGVSGTVSGSDKLYEVVLAEDTDPTKPITIKLTGSLGVAAAANYYFRINNEVSEKMAAEENPFSLSINPEWENGRATVLVGFGNANKIAVQYTLELSILGQAKEDYNKVRLGEEKNQKYFLSTVELSGATAVASSVSDTDFSNNSKNHKATVEYTLAERPTEPVTLKFTAMKSDTFYISCDGAGREEAKNGKYEKEMDLSSATAFTFITYSTSSNSTVRGTYTIKFKIQGAANMPPTRKDGSIAGEELNFVTDRTYTKDLNSLFQDPEGEPLTYTVSINDADPIEAASTYSFPLDTPGTYKLVFRASDGKSTSADCYTATLTVAQNASPTLTGDSSAEAIGMQYGTYKLDLSKIFADDDALTYTVKIGEADAVSAAVNYSYTPQTAGTHTLVFLAKDPGGRTSPEYTVTLNVAEAFQQVITTPCTDDKGTGDTYVKSITVTGPEVIGYVWNVAAGHAENSEHVLFIRLNTETADDAIITLAYAAGYKDSGFRGSVSGPASATLSEGTATATITTSGWMSQGTPRTYKIYFTNEANIAPAVVDNAITEVAVNTGEVFRLNLSEIFSDANGDALSYTVKEGDGGAVAAEAEFSQTIASSGDHTFVFTATDVWGDSVSHTVTVTAAMSENTSVQTVLVPEGITPVFSVTAGYDDNGTDIPGEVLTAASGTAKNGLIPYTVTVPDGITTISVRAEGWGGMTFPAVADSTITLRKVKMNVLDYNNQPAENSSSVTYGDHAAAFGPNGLLLVAGEEYVFSAVPTDTASFVTSNVTKTLGSGEGDFVLNLILDIKNPMKITVTTGAKAQLYRYNQYYSSTELDAKIIKDNGDGTTTYSFIADISSGSYMYRVSLKGKITKAGWLKWGTQNLTVLHSDKDKANTWRLDNYVATGQSNSSVTEDSVLLNINSRNHLSLLTGQTKTLKAYRAWEIIPDSSNNRILTPDFTYTILSGSDVVSLTEKASLSTADGDWMTLTALKEGTAIIEVTYDALEVSGGGYDGTYGASDPARSGLVVVTVGESDASVDFGIESFASAGTKGANNISYNPKAKKAWDAEFDTLYFTGEKGTLNFSPSAASEILSVAVSNDKGKSWTTLTAAEGVYTANIVPGNNILCVTTESGSAYQIVRGDKVTVKLVEVPGSSDEDGIIEAGETVRVTLWGLHLPIPKMAGNYNPGYLANSDGYSGHHLNYTSNGQAIHGSGAQYNFITTSNYVQVVMPQDGSNVTLTDGYIGLGVIGLTSFTDGGDSHRNIPDAGCSTRGSSSTWHTRSILPEITIEVDMEAAANTSPSVRDNAPVTATLELSESIYTYAINLATAVFMDPDQVDRLTYTVKVNDGEATSVSDGYYTLVRPEVGTYTLLFTVSDGKASAEHTLELTVTEAEIPEPDPDEDQNKEDKHVVYVSFVDFATRVAGESGVDYPNQLGTIIPRTAVSYDAGDTIADVTLRLLDSKGMTYDHDGTTKAGFYLRKIGNFTSGGILIEEFGEFDAGNGSGWMITQNGVFIGKGASEFTVKDGDVIEWKFTCQLGQDIGDPFWDDQKKEDKKEEKDSENPFTDVAEDAFYFEAVKWAVEQGITNGTGETSFSPNASCTRAQMVTFLWRAAGSPKAKEVANAFIDVDAGAYYYEALLWAVEQGITNGTSKTSFSPDSVCSRAQMATFLYRSAKSPAVEGDHAFGDVEDNAYYENAVIWAAQEGITNGTSTNTFSPSADCTRGQMVTFLYRYLAE